MHYLHNTNVSLGELIQCLKKGPQNYSSQLEDALSDFDASIRLVLSDVVRSVFVCLHRRNKNHYFI